MPTPLFCLSGPTRAPFSPVHQMLAGQQIRVSVWQWRLGTGGQSSRLMLGWAVVAEGVQDGRKCRSQLVCKAASARTWLLFVLVVVSTTHSCASKSGMVHTHCGMPSRACVSISTKAQIKSNQVLHTIPKAHFTTRHPSNDNTSTPKMRTNRPHDVAHASVPVIPSRERVDAAPVCSSSRTRDGTASPASPPPFGGEEAGGAREG